jgi:hypothetical protein
MRRYIIAENTQKPPACSKGLFSIASHGKNKIVPVRLEDADTVEKEICCEEPRGWIPSNPKSETATKSRFAASNWNHKITQPVSRN